MSLIAVVWWYIPKIINFIGWHEQRGFRAYRTSRKSYQRYNTTPPGWCLEAFQLYIIILLWKIHFVSRLFMYLNFFFKQFFCFPFYPSMPHPSSYLSSPIIPYMRSSGTLSCFVSTSATFLLRPKSVQSPMIFFTITTRQENKFYYVEMDRGDAWWRMRWKLITFNTYLNSFKAKYYALEYEIY